MYKNWEDAEKSGKVFWKIVYYDRSKEYVSRHEDLYAETKAEAEAYKTKLEKANVLLKQKMLDIFKEHGLTENNIYDNFFLNDFFRNHLRIHGKEIILTEEQHLLFRAEIGSNRGYCFIEIHERDLLKEAREEFEENEREEKEAKKYGRRCGEEQPYGGAFDSWEHFYMWKEGGSL